MIISNRKISFLASNSVHLFVIRSFSSFIYNKTNDSVITLSEVIPDESNILMMGLKKTEDYKRKLDKWVFRW